MIRREKELADQIARSLGAAGIPFDREASLGGFHPDFIAYLPGNRTFMIDVKVWEKHLGFRNRAAHQVSRYKEIFGVDEAFVVLDNLQRSSVPEGVVTIDRLVPVLLEHCRAATPRKQRKPISRVPQEFVFAAMPFEAVYDDTFLVAMTHAAKEVGAVCRRVDTVQFSGDVVAEIHALIRESIAVIVDLSESRPNVLYEAGYAHALDKPAVHICSTPLSELPFDVAHWNTLPYDQGRTSFLRGPLTEGLRAVLRRRESRSDR